ncbi:MULTISPECIES: hypothetical protein [Paenibacillus]|uniref:hypothetical protein n=1 Tax=Paenibacillus TaxID=44249 RepID=UPI0008399F8B|nr:MULTISPECIES: hypothetical protein [Paenibacillus]GIP20362.1 hypothetical protein J22TS3_06370 [Paenibacillus sp. J22TS3]
MRKSCDCGQEMSLDFRKVIFEGRIEIENVPILQCESCTCGSYEVLPEVKPHLLSLIGEWRQLEGSRVIHFNEINEIASLLYDTLYTEPDSEPIEHVLERKKEDRINLLLDIYGYAKDKDDSLWMKDISERLSQLTLFHTNRQVSRIK